MYIRFASICIDVHYSLFTFFIDTASSSLSLSLSLSLYSAVVPLYSFSFLFLFLLLLLLLLCVQLGVVYLCLNHTLSFDVDVFTSVYNCDAKMYVLYACTLLTASCTVPASLSRLTRQ